MRKPNIQDLVYSRTFPNKRQDDPPSLHAHVLRNLVPEVRIEVQTYYGALDCLEAQYPGLDYTYAPHRKRLGRYPWHRRLFRVFDELRLTKDEILSLCVWEGTRAAKERFERDTNTRIESTTLDDVAVAPRGSGPRAVFFYYDDDDDVQHADHIPAAIVKEGLGSIVEEGSPQEHGEHVGNEASEQSQSKRTGLQLLADASRSHEHIEADNFHDQWEQWMKEALERNELDLDFVLNLNRVSGMLLDSAEATPVRSDEEQHNSIDESQINSENPPDTDIETTRSSATSRSTNFNALRTILDDLRSTRDRLAAENAALAMIMSRTHPTEAR